MLRITVLLVTLCFTASHVAGHECRPGWTQYNGVCYGYGEARVSWADAQAICDVYNAKLAEIETTGENDFLKLLARAKGDDHVWIGGNDIFHEGNWEWADNSGKLHPFSDWLNGQPDDNNGREDCLHFWGAYGYKWNDTPCGSAMNFICEERVPGSAHSP